MLPLNGCFPAGILQVGAGFVTTWHWFNVPPCALQPTNKPVEWWSEEEEEGLLVKLIYVVWEWLRICETAGNNFHVVKKKKVGGGGGETTELIKTAAEWLF